MKTGDNEFTVSQRAIKSAQTRRKNGTKQNAWYWNSCTKPMFAQLEAGETVVITTGKGREVSIIPA